MKFPSIVHMELCLCDWREHFQLRIFKWKTLFNQNFIVFLMISFFQPIHCTHQKFIIKRKICIQGKEHNLISYRRYSSTYFHNLNGQFLHFPYNIIHNHIQNLLGIYVFYIIFLYVVFKNKFTIYIQNYFEHFCLIPYILHTFVVSIFYLQVKVSYQK